MKEAIKYLIFLIIIVAVVANTVMTCLLVTWVSEDRTVLRNVQNDLQKLKVDLEKEIKLREDLFPKLKKSASLLSKYNRRLDSLTALKYAAKIYECSNEELPINILTALIVVESSANYLAKSRKGAMGLTQVMPKIWNFGRILGMKGQLSCQKWSLITGFHFFRKNCLTPIFAFYICLVTS